MALLKKFVVCLCGFACPMNFSEAAASRDLPEMASEIIELRLKLSDISKKFEILVNKMEADPQHISKPQSEYEQNITEVKREISGLSDRIKKLEDNFQEPSTETKEIEPTEEKKVKEPVASEKSKKSEEIEKPKTIEKTKKVEKTKKTDSIKKTPVKTDESPNNNPSEEEDIPEEEKVTVNPSEEEEDAEE